MNTNLNQTRQSVILIGGGGHALVIAEAVRACGVELIGFLDDDANPPLAHATVAEPAFAQRLGPIAALKEHASTAPCHLAIGDLGVRERILFGSGISPLEWVSVMHPSAMVAASARIGGGSFVGARAVVQARAIVGEACIVNTGAIIEHECLVGENCHIAPGSIVGGRVRIGRGTLIGIGAVIRPGVSIGAGCIVGAGAVVVNNVVDGAVVVGVPARETHARKR